MGTKLETIPAGVGCGNWDPPEDSPIAIYAMFFDMKKGDRGGAQEPPNEHIFRLDQDPLSPCDWIYNNATFDWEIHLNVQAGNISIDLRESVVPNKIYFDDTMGPPPLLENQVFTNDYLTPVNNYGWGGYCIVFWMSTVITLAGAWGFLDVPDLFFELFVADPPNIVIKFCSLSIGMNVSMKFPI